jgi:general secretion pathway protein B
MSYILDALKKSDQQRQRGVTPTLLTAQATATAPNRSRRLLNSILAAVLICAGVLIGWLQPWQSDQSVLAPTPVATKPITPGPHVAAQVPPPLMPEMVGNAEQEPLLQKSASVAQPALRLGASAMKQDAPTLAKTEPHPTQSQAVTVVPKEAAMPLPEKTVLTGPVDTGQVKKVMALNELPASVQQEIPGISISFHAYSSSPKDRHVMINGAMVGQGESLAPGLSLEEITPDGVILGYKGYRFHRGVR